MNPIPSAQSLSLKHRVIAILIPTLLLIAVLPLRAQDLLSSTEEISLITPEPANPGFISHAFIPDVPAKNKYMLTVFHNYRDLLYIKINGLEESQKCLFTIVRENGKTAMVTEGVRSRNAFFIDIARLKPGNYTLIAEIPGVVKMKEPLTRTR